MRRVRVIVEYEGTNYAGWQTQPNGVSVQETLERALKKVTGEKTAVHGSGRTDSGVHARAQVAHFDTGARMPADKFAVAMNMLLPEDIRVLFSETAPGGFHARFSAKEKSYRYTVQCGPHARVFSRTTALHVYTPLDVPAMRRAAADCVGTYDFSAFMSAGTSLEDRVRTVFTSEWVEDGAFLHYGITGNGFLYNMVRILAGTMLEIGRGRLPEDTIRRAIVSGARADAGATAPAHGLTLMRVKYDDFDTDEVLHRL